MSLRNREVITHSSITLFVHGGEVSLSEEDRSRLRTSNSELKSRPKEVNGNHGLD
jgi:hypothetical protein